MARIVAALCSGRPIVCRVAQCLVQRIPAAARDSTEVIVVVDEEWTGGPIPRCGANVTWVAGGEQKRLREQCMSLGVTRRSVEVLFQRRGYAKQRNLALLYALVTGAQRVLLLDDDEYYTVPVLTPDGLQWVGQDVLLAHGNTPQLVANGAHWGYVAPLPQFNGYLPTWLLGELGTALSIGSEFIDEDFFIRNGDGLPKCQTYASAATACDADPVVRASNLSLDMHAIRSGRLPPFFSPPGARGEDAIFSLCGAAKLLGHVAAGTFHDPFLRYTSLLDGKSIGELTAIRPDTASLTRFAGACVGWVRYAPVLTRLQGQARSASDALLREMSDRLARIEGQLADRTGRDELRTLSRELRRYWQRVEADLEDLWHACDTWRALCRAFSDTHGPNAALVAAMPEPPVASE